MPELLRERAVPARIVVAIVIPAVFGAICGWLLGVNEIAYTVLTLLALFGAYAAGLEHEGAAEGALRGAVGGALFGAFILLAHEATGDEAKAELPEPEIVLVAITTIASAVVGAFGGRRRKQREEEGTADQGFEFSPSNIKPSEFVGFAGAAILLLSLFLPWFATSCDENGQPEGCNANSKIHGDRGSFSAFETFSILDVLLVAACVAPFVLAYIIARGHELAWRPGEVTMIIGMIAIALILLNGIILGRPGEEPDNVEISLKIGYLVALVGATAIMMGGVVRQARYQRARKPPGVL